MLRVVGHDELEGRKWQRTHGAPHPPPSKHRTPPPYKPDGRYPWAAFERVADRYSVKARSQDREDLRDNIILRLATLTRRRRKAKGTSELSELQMYRVASLCVHEYYNDLKRQSAMTSLNAIIIDREGKPLEVGDTIIDDQALDLDAWVDARVWLLHCPARLVQIAHKKRDKRPLTPKERQYLSRWRKAEVEKRQHPLFPMSRFEPVKS